LVPNVSRARTCDSFVVKIDSLKLFPSNPLDTSSQRIRPDRAVAHPLRKIVLRVLEHDLAIACLRGEEFSRVLTGGVCGEDEAVAPAVDPHELVSYEGGAALCAADSKKDAARGGHPMFLDDHAVRSRFPATGQPLEPGHPRILGGSRHRTESEERNGEEPVPFPHACHGVISTRMFELPFPSHQRGSSSRVLISRSGSAKPRTHFWDAFVSYFAAYARDTA
jgi:hypothetical protein